MGLLSVCLRRKRWYFMLWRTMPPESTTPSHRTATTFCPDRICLAMIDARRPSI